MKKHRPSDWVISNELFYYWKRLYDQARESYNNANHPLSQYVDFHLTGGFVNMHISSNRVLYPDKRKNLDYIHIHLEYRIYSVIVFWRVRSFKKENHEKARWVYSRRTRFWKNESNLKKKYFNRWKTFVKRRRAARIIINAMLAYTYNPRRNGLAFQRWCLQLDQMISGQKQ